MLTPSFISLGSPFFLSLTLSSPLLPFWVTFTMYMTMNDKRKEKFGRLTLIVWLPITSLNLRVAPALTSLLGSHRFLSPDLYTHIHIYTYEQQYVATIILSPDTPSLTYFFFVYRSKKCCSMSSKRTRTTSVTPTIR